MMVFPDSDNCFGRIRPPRNLHAMAAQLTVRGWQANVQSSQSSAGECLYLESSDLKLRSEASGGGEHVLDGVIAIDGRRGDLAVAALSDGLQEINVPHHFELYDSSSKDVNSSNRCRSRQAYHGDSRK